MLSIVFLLKSFTMFSPLNDYTVFPPLTLISRLLVVHVSYYYILMNIPNLNHVHVYVVSWVMVLNIKDFIVGIPSLNNYAYHVMSPFENIICFLVFLHFMHLSLVLIHSSLILLLIYFPQLPHHLTLHIVHYPYLSSLNLIIFLCSQIFNLSN